MSTSGLVLTPRSRQARWNGSPWVRSERLLAKQFDRACDDADRGLALRLVALGERMPLPADHAVLFHRQALKLVEVVFDPRSGHVRAEVKLDPDALAKPLIEGGVERLRVLGPRDQRGAAGPIQTGSVEGSERGCAPAERDDPARSDVEAPVAKLASEPDESLERVGLDAHRLFVGADDLGQARRRELLVVVVL